MEKVERTDHLIIDGSNFLYRFCLVEDLKLYNSNLVDIGPVYYAIRMLYNLIETYQPKEVHIIFDIGRSIVKRERFKQYKENRKISNTWTESLSDVAYERIKFSRFLMMEFLSFTPIKVYSVPLVEGDTILGLIALELSKDKSQRIRIYSHDKDNFQLIDENVSILYKDRKTRLIKEVGYEDIDNVWEKIINRPVKLKALAEKTGNRKISFLNLPFYRALLGDESDGIPGIKKIGPGLVSILAHSQQFLGIENLKEPSDFYSLIEATLEIKDILPAIFKDIGLKYPRVSLDRLAQFLDNKEEKEIFELNLNLMFYPLAIKNEITPQILASIYSVLREKKKYDAKKFLDFIREHDFNSDSSYQWYDLLNRALEKKDYSLIISKASKTKDLQVLFESLYSKLKPAEF